jgi:hypothetical protein
MLKEYVKLLLPLVDRIPIGIFFQKIRKGKDLLIFQREQLIDFKNYNSLFIIQKPATNYPGNDISRFK